MARHTERIPLPAMSPGTERSVVVHRYGTPGAGPKAYFHAALHADEPPVSIGVQKGPPCWDVAARRDGVFRTVVDLSDVPGLQLRAPVARDPAPDRHGFAPRASRTLGRRSSRNSKSFDGYGGCGVVGEGRRGGQREALSTARRPVRAAHRPQIHSRGRASPLGLRARSRQARFLKRQESLPVSTMSQ